jgi:hypothetical protein
MSRRAVGITSYYNRVTPAYKSSRNRPVKREDKPLHAVKESPVTEVKREPTPRWMDLEGQALLCLVIILLVASVINQVIKLCG